MKAVINLLKTVVISTAFIVCLTACGDGIDKKQGNGKKHVDYSGQEIEFCGYTFNIPDYYTDMNSLGGETGSVDETQKYFMADNSLNGMISFYAEDIVMTSNDYFMENAKDFLSGFCSGVEGGDISFYDSEVAGIPAQGAKFSGTLMDLGSYDYDVVMFYDTKVKKTIGIIATQAKNGSAQRNYLADLENIVATGRVTGTADNSETIKSTQSEEPQALILKDSFGVMTSSYGGTEYVTYAGIINNPNNNKIAEFPKLIVTIKASDGSILGTGDQMGSYIMGNDTITLVGLMSMPEPETLEGATIHYSVECSDFINESNNNMEYKRTSNFLVSNVSEKNSGESFVTGEVKNISEYNEDLVNVAMLLRKDGKIVYAENLFIDNLSAGQTKAFQFQSYDGWPQHDSVEVSAMAW